MSSSETFDEVYETEIGIFKILPDPTDEAMVIVKNYVIGPFISSWENMGIMKKKDFFKFIEDHNPRKKDSSNYRKRVSPAF